MNANLRFLIPLSTNISIDCRTLSQVKILKYVVEIDIFEENAVRARRLVHFLREAAAGRLESSLKEQNIMVSVRAPLLSGRLTDCFTFIPTYSLFVMHLFVALCVLFSVCLWELCASAFYFNCTHFVQLSLPSKVLMCFTALLK